MPCFRLVEQRRGTSEFVLVQLHATMEFREPGGIVRWQKVPARFGPFVIVSLHLASVGLAQGASKRLALGSDGEETRRETSRTQPLQPPRRLRLVDAAKMPVLTRGRKPPAHGAAALIRIRARVWMAHADECSLDPEETIKVVRATARRMPDTVAQARDEARSRNENKSQSSVNRRVTEILRYADARRRAFEQALAAMGRRSG